MQKFNLNQAVAVITGGAGLLGPKHAEAIIEGGGRAVLLDINQEALDKTVQALQDAYGDKVWGYKLDITWEDDVKAVVDKIEKEVGPIQILINNAANNPHVVAGDQVNLTRFENFPLDHWQGDLAVQVTGSFLMSKIIGSRMAQRKKGVILNIASDLGVIAPDQRIYRNEDLAEDQQPVKPVTYSVTKHALIGLTKYLATYWADQGVRANAISPGGIYNNQPDDFVAKLSRLIPMGRMADRDEYKAAVLFMCSDASSYMNGANVSIDGGRTCW